MKSIQLLHEQWYMLAENLKIVLQVVKEIARRRCLLTWPLYCGYQ